MACGDNHRGRAQAVVALYRARGGPRSETRSGAGLAQDCVADRRHQRASRAAARPYHRDYSDLEQLRQRVAALNGAGKMDKEIATALNREGFVAARGCTFKGENVWLLCQR